MTIAVAQTITSNSNSALITYTSASWTPVSASNLVLFAFGWLGTAPVADADPPSGNSATGYTKIAGRGFNTSASPARKVELWAATTTAATDTTQFNLKANAQGMDWAIIELSGADPTRGTAGTAQAVTNFSDTSSSALAATLASFSGSGNGTLSVFFSGAASYTPKSGFVELSDNGWAGGLKLETQFKASNDTTPSATPSTSTIWGALATEIWVAAAPPLVTTKANRLHVQSGAVHRASRI